MTHVMQTRRFLSKCDQNQAYLGIFDAYYIPIYLIILAYYVSIY